MPLTSCASVSLLRLHTLPLATLLDCSLCTFDDDDDNSVTCYFFHVILEDVFLSFGGFRFATLVVFTLVDTAYQVLSGELFIEFD